MRTPFWFKRLIIFLPILFAHKPLCSFFKKDLFCVKGIYICRSCSFLVLGFFLGMLSVISFNLFHYKIYIHLSFFVSIIIFILSYPKLYAKIVRLMKDWLRFFLGWTIANTLFLLIFKKIFLFLLALSFLWVLKVIYSEARSKIKNTVCDNCEEFSQDKLCSGFLPKARLMKKYEEEIKKTYLK